MKKKVPAPAQDSRLRVGVFGIVPMRILGLQELFHGNPAIDIVHDNLLQLLRNSTVRILILGARSSASLVKLMAGIKTYRADIRVLAMLSATDDESILQVVAAGAKGYLRDTATEVEVQQAIQVVEAGSLWAPRPILSQLIERMSSAAASTVPLANSSFTKREREVLELLVAGQPNKDIAKALQIEEHTVKAHVGRLMRKVGVNSRTALTMHAVSIALVETVENG